MRMRRKPWARPELAACPFFIDDAAAMLGRWQGAFARPGQPLVLEIGCGKGGFIAHEAAVHPERNYLVLDIKSEVLAVAKRAAEREFAAAGRPVDNLLSASWDIERIGQILDARDAVAALYINFPNPWPKPKHWKRRLTHPRQLALYRAFLADGAPVRFKTDDDGLFRASARYFSASGYAVERIEPDLYAGGAPAGAVLTEHEEMFLAQGLPIHYIEARKLPDSAVQLPDPAQPETPGGVEPPHAAPAAAQGCP